MVNDILMENNNIFAGDIVAESVEGYEGKAGLAQSVIELAQMSEEFFDECMRLDIMESAVAHGKMAEERLNKALDEAVLTEEDGGSSDSGMSLKDRIVSMLQKAWNAIVNFIMTAKKRIEEFVTRDIIKLVDRFEKESKGKDLSNIKVKVAQATGFTPKVPANASRDVMQLYSMSEDQLKKEKEKYTGDGKNERYSDILGEKTTAKEFVKACKKKMRKEPQEVQLTQGMVDVAVKLIRSIKGEGGSLKELNDQKKAVDTYYKETIKSIKNIRHEGRKGTVTQTDGDVKATTEIGYKKRFTLACDVARSAVTTNHEVQTKVISVLVDDIKLSLAQYRAMFLKAVNAKEATSTNEAVSFDELLDICQEEVELAIEA